VPWLPAAAAQVDTISQFKANLQPSYVNTTASLPDSAYLSPASCPYTTVPTATKAGLLEYANMHVPGRQDASTWNRSAGDRRS
jgi:hypothetical protein